MASKPQKARTPKGSVRAQATSNGVQVTGNQKDPIKVTVPAGTTRYVEDGSGNLVSDGTSTADEVIYADAASLVKARTC